MKIISCDESTLSAYVDKKVKIEKFGESLEGILKPGTMTMVTGPSSIAQTWALEFDDKSFDFVPSDGWTISEV